MMIPPLSAHGSVVDTVVRNSMARQGRIVAVALDKIVKLLHDQLRLARTAPA
jgi:hypothetical protein